MAAEQAGPGHRGRPRRAAIDAAIIRAAVDLMTEGGVGSTSLTAVAERAGVARATVYLRWPTRSALVGAAARAAVGGQPLALSGDIERDIRAGSAFMRQIFELPSTRAILPEMIRGVLADPPELTFESIAPRRRAFAENYAAGADAQGFDPSADPHLAFDILLGTHLTHLLAHGRAMPAADADRLAEVVIEGLRFD